MKHLLLTTIAAVLLAGCGKSQQSAKPAEAKPVEPVPKAATPEPTTPKASDISIHAAAGTRNLESLKQHLAAGTDVNAKDDAVKTPLHRAALLRHKETIELLIAAGADVNAKLDDGITPLDRAEKLEDFQKSPETKAAKKETADFLRKHGGKTGAELK